MEGKGVPSHRTDGDGCERANGTNQGVNREGIIILIDFYELHARMHLLSIYIFK